MAETGIIPATAIPGKVVSMGYGAISVLITDPSGQLTMKEMTKSAKDLMESIFKNLKRYEKAVVAINQSLPVMGSCSSQPAAAVVVEEDDPEEKPHKEVDPSIAAGGEETMVA